MKVAEIILKNFKRFQELWITDIPQSTRLVLIVGPNGCGKSSIFDALHHWHRINTGLGFISDEKYYRKDAAGAFDWHASVTVNTHGNTKPSRGCVYARTAYRNDPDFNRSEFSRPAPPTENVRFNRLIENDATVSENYQRLVYDSLNSLYDPTNSQKTAEQLREELIGGIRQSMARVFGDLVLNNLADPLQSGAFYFAKGATANYHYKNLSGGEKSAFDLLLDLHVKRRFYGDAVYCIDEIETHLHTSVQGKLVAELLTVIPNNSQLWLTTHSLGVMRAAQVIEKNAPGTVCVLDFSGRDFDTPQKILPSRVGRIAWEKLLSVALDDLSPQVAPKFVIICEGSRTGNRRKDFDAEVYTKIFAPHSADVVFVSGGSALQVTTGGPTLQASLSRIVSGATVFPLIDRDDQSQVEVGNAQAQGTIVLSLRNIESYLFADEVLAALASKEAKPQLVPQLLAAKQVAMAASVTRGNAPDDLKSAAGEIYVQTKKLLQLTACGNTTEAFMRDTLAPLLQPGMQAYETLRSDILVRIGA